MNLKDMGEFGWIDRIRENCLIRKDAVLKGIGDDAAVFQVAPDTATLVTTDLLVERVHFLKDAASPFDLGYKALAVNLSDIAAMGGTPREAFVSIGIPKDFTVEYLDALYQGMKHLAAEHRVNILGGDTTGSKTDLIINIMVVGTAPPEEILYRHGARPGDVILSTGFLGDSRAGLHLILEGIPLASPHLKDLVLSHLKPYPYVREGRFLARHGGVRSAIDVSDGLSSDLSHILKAG
ncbi:MAG: thiamine-phosphate kinase, partial [Deltaproteobacteria bacterium]|nr:thiamine-phosphate kinase [Deltaproteobacteria bacterium]